MTNNKSPAQRIVKLRTDISLSQSEFASRIGITQGALSQLESGKTALSLTTIKHISEAFDVDCNWLVFGAGGRAKTPAYSNVAPNRANLVPLIKEEAHAGYISQCSDEDYISALDVYKIPGFENGDYRMFEIEGDSMIPTIHPREIVVTEHVVNWGDIENGTLCVLICEDGIVAKRVYLHEDGKERFILKSDNPDYKTYAVSKQDVLEIWQITAKITNEFNSTSVNSSDRFDSIELEISKLKEEIVKMGNASVQIGAKTAQR